MYRLLLPQGREQKESRLFWKAIIRPPRTAYFLSWGVCPQFNFFKNLKSVGELGEESSLLSRLVGCFPLCLNVFSHY